MGGQKIPADVIELMKGSKGSSSGLAGQVIYWHQRCTIVLQPTPSRHCQSSPGGPAECDTC